MKTFDELKEGIAVECGYKDFRSLADDMLSDYELLEFYLRGISRAYAEQAVEECVLLSERESWESDIDTVGTGHVLSRLGERVDNVKEQLT